MSKKQKQTEFTTKQRDFLRTVELAILELPRTEKQLIFDCWQNNTTPPDHLREYCRVFIDAVSISPKIADVLKQPRSMAITKEHAENQTPQQRAEIERFVIDRIALFRATGEDARQFIKAAILDKEQGEKLTDEEKYILGNVWAVLKVAEHNAAILQSIFNLDNNQINAAIKEARQAEYIAIPIPEDETGALTYGGAELSPSLPGLEENTDTKPTPRSITSGVLPVATQGVITYPDKTLFSVSKLQRKLPLWTDSGDDWINLAITPKIIQKIRLNFITVPGHPTPTRLTPYDQEVENAVSNLIENNKEECITAEQIYYQLAGIEDKTGVVVTPKQTEAITASINRLAQTRVTVYTDDAEKQAEISNYPALQKIDYKVYNKRTKKTKIGFLFEKVGLFYWLDKRDNKLLNVSRDQLNIKASGVQITEVSVTIRRYLLQEIFRIRNNATNDNAGNAISYEAVYRYESAPEIVEYDATGGLVLEFDTKHQKMRPKLKEPADHAEYKRIHSAKEHRREIIKNILAHLKKTGLIRNFKEKPDKSGVILDVEKTITAIKAIETTEKRKRKYNRTKKRADFNL